MKAKKSYWWFHVIGTIIYLSFPVIFSPDLSSNLKFIHIKGFQRDLFTHLLLLLSFYLSYLIYIPRFYFNKKYIYYLAAIAATFTSVILLRELIFHHPHHAHHEIMEGNHRHEPPALNFFFFIGRDFLSFSLAILFPLMLRISAKWKQTEQEKINTELSFLKAQINPHFLFNSLNSIYAMSINEKADKSADAVQKLSEMMRYVLEESENELVSLTKEISYISNYVELQKIRFGDTARINFSINGNFENKKIAPLLLIPFVENAFKFGISPDSKSSLSIHIEILNDKLHLNVKNEKLRLNFHDSESHGIGLKNTKSRLQLLYPVKHTLEIKETEKEFHVNLNINLL